MSEDRSPDLPQQVPPKAVNLTEALFGPHIDQCWVTAGIAGNKATWKGHFWKEDKVRAFDPQHGHYFCIALPKKGASSRDIANFEAGRLIVVDDVGVMISDDTLKIAPGAKVDIETFRMFAPETNYEVETSASNFQMGYVIEPVERDFARWSHFINEMKKHPLFGKGFEDCTPVHYVRMETGRNQPKPNRPRSYSRLAKAYDGGGYTLDELAEAFGIDMSVSAVTASQPTKASGETCSIETLKKLLGLLPNDSLFDLRVAPGEPCWVSMAAAIRNITGGSDEGFQLWLGWCDQRAQTPGAPEALWESVYEPKASAATLRIWIEKKYGGKYSREYQLAAADINQDQAPDAFEEIPDAVGIDPTAGAEAEKVEKKLNELLAAIARTQTVPEHHRSGDTPHWGKNGKVQTLRDAATSIVAPPVILTPYERGLLSVLGGMPGLGKSLLILQQALAITYDRKDLLRHGVAKLNFKGDVIYISNEDGLGIMKRRFRAWERRHKLESTVPPYDIIPLKSTLLSWDGKGWQAECLDILEMILEYVRGGRDIAMIIVDTLATSVTGIDENQARDINPVMLFLDRLSKLFWASVVFIHHVNKGSVGDEDRSIVALKGSFSIGGAVRGAVTLTPASKTEVADYGWKDREVVAEYVAKANDDRARYVACYYELLTEDIEVGDAVDPTRVSLQPTPVLVPLRPVKGIDDLETLKGWFSLIEQAINEGRQVRRYDAGAPNVGAKSAHHVLGVTVKKAYEIVDKLVSMGWVEVLQIRDEDVHAKVPMVVLKEAI